MQKKGIIIAFISLILAIFFIDHEMKKAILIAQKLKSEKSSKITPQSDNFWTQPVEVQKPKEEIIIKLKPEDPAKYGMVVNEAKSMPHSPEEWEAQLRETFEKHQTFESEAAKKALEVAKTKPADYEKQMNDLDHQIELIQQRLKDEPLNQDNEEQLQMLYQLKAVGKILKEKVLNTDELPVQNAVPDSIPQTSQESAPSPAQ